MFLINIGEEEYIISFKTKLMYYSNLFSSTIGKKNNEFKQIKSIKSGIKLTDNYTVLKQCNLSREKNKLYFYKKKTKEILEKYNCIEAKNYSFLYSINGLALIPRKENESKNKILLCACKNY